MSEPSGKDAAPTIPATANTGAIATMGLQLQKGVAIPRKRIISWAFWDWATQPFNTVLLTFIYVPLFLTSDFFLAPDIAAQNADDSIDCAVDTGTAYCHSLADLATNFGWGSLAAGLLIALIAPVLGQRADAAGQQKRWLGIFTGLLVATMVGLGFVTGSPQFFWFGVALMALGTVFSEIAAVNYNAMLVSVSTPKTVGKVSGLGWGFGYIGGIVALVLVVVFYASDWFGLPAENGLPFQLIALGCAVWAIIFVIPLFRNVPEPGHAKKDRQVGFFQSYALLVKDIKRLFRETRPTFWFLIASAVFRDGLAGVFAFGAVIAAQVFGFEFLDLVIFGIAANLIAGVIITSLGALVVAALMVFFLHSSGTIIFWIFGLLLCAFVGPAQAASRSFLARVTPAGREGEIFGLYATTGRVASFISPGLWTLAIAISGSTIFGVLGIAVVLLVGLMLLLFVKLPDLRASASGQAALPGALD
jgi:UMF1 family MFS transporter